MNGFKDEQGYLDYLARRAKARAVGIWDGGTIMTNLSTCNLKKVLFTKFTNSNPNPKCLYKKKRKRQN